ncbi:MAG: cbb3-type cytochrome c oxidase subunit 3 [Gammaproteobacteria bacterium]|nr:cbb3-type cytochrome c oxidase subunit 3 [Gammaproteobacteria bacterium]
MDMNTFRGLETVALLVLFIGLVIWAYSSKRKKDFDEAANMPLNEDDDGIDHSMNAAKKQKNQGE